MQWHGQLGRLHLECNIAAGKTLIWQMQAADLALKLVGLVTVGVFDERVRQVLSLRPCRLTVATSSIKQPYLGNQ